MLSPFNIDKLTSLLRDFYNVTRIRITVFDGSFYEIAAYPKEAGPFCQLIRTDASARPMCDLCGRDACMASAKKRGLQIRQCHAGLKEAVMPIYLGSLLVCYLYFGQTLAYDSREEAWKVIEEKCAGYQVSVSDLKAACSKQPLMDEACLLSAANLMQTIASHLCMERLAALRREDLPIQIDNYIQEHLAENIDADAICSHFQIGRKRLCEISRESYGTGIMEAIRSRRIEKARLLLMGSPHLNLHEVASSCGFRDYNHFAAVFKKATGISPRQYR